MKCKVCNKDFGLNGIRLGVCFDCAEIESIIGEGLDMDNKGMNSDSISAKTAMEKLIFMRKKIPSYFS